MNREVLMALTETRSVHRPPVAAAVTIGLLVFLGITALAGGVALILGVAR
jgi:hypothetical protein